MDVVVYKNTFWRKPKEELMEIMSANGYLEERENKTEDLLCQCDGRRSTDSNGVTNTNIDIHLDVGSFAEKWFYNHFSQINSIQSIFSKEIMH
jgi:hypothetical protein